MGVAYTMMMTTTTMMVALQVTPPCTREPLIRCSGGRCSPICRTATTRKKRRKRMRGGHNTMPYCYNAIGLRPSGPPPPFQSLSKLLLCLVMSSFLLPATNATFPPGVRGTISGFDMGGQDPICWHAPTLSTTDPSTTTMDILVLRPPNTTSSTSSSPSSSLQESKEIQQQQQQTESSQLTSPPFSRQHYDELQLDRNEVQLLSTCPNGTSLDVVIDPKDHTRLERQPKGWKIGWNEQLKVTLHVRLDVTQQWKEHQQQQTSALVLGDHQQQQQHQEVVLPPPHNDTELLMVVTLCQVGYGGASCSPFVSQTSGHMGESSAGISTPIKDENNEEEQGPSSSSSSSSLRLPSSATALETIRLGDMKPTGSGTYEHSIQLELENVKSGTYSILASMLFLQTTTITTTMTTDEESNTTIVVDVNHDNDDIINTTSSTLLRPGQNITNSTGIPLHNTTTTTITTTTTVTVVSNIPSHPDDLLVTILEKHEPQHVTQAARLTVLVLSSVGAAVLAWLLYQTIRHQESQVFKLTQGKFLIAMLTAALIATVSCFTFEPANKIFCSLPGPLIVLPIHIMFSILLGRLWRIRAVISPLLLLTLEKKEHWTNSWVKLLYRWTSHQPPKKKIRLVISEAQLGRVICLFILPQILCQALTLILQDNELIILPDSDGGGIMTCRFNFFNSKVEMAGLIVLLILFAIMVILARTSRDMPSLFNETQAFVDVAVLSFLIFGISGIVLLSTAGEDVSPNISYLVRSLAIVSMAVNTSVKLLLPKLKVVWRGDVIVVTKLLADHHKTRKSGPQTITLEESGVPTRRASLISGLKSRRFSQMLQLGASGRTLHAHKKEDENAAGQEAVANGPPSMDFISSMKDSEFDNTGVEFADDASDTSSVVLYTDERLMGSHQSMRFHNSANINNPPSEDPKSGAHGGPLARMRQSLFQASGSLMQASTRRMPTTHSVSGSKDGSSKEPMEFQDYMEQWDVEDSAEQNYYGTSMSTLGADFSVATPNPPTAGPRPGGYARGTSRRGVFRKNASNKNNPIAVSDHSKYSMGGQSIAGNSIVSRATYRRRGSLPQKRSSVVGGGGEKKEKPKGSSPFGKIGASFWGKLSNHGNKSQESLFEIGYNPRRRSDEIITISETSAPGRRLLLRMIDTQQTLTRLNTAILSGLSVDPSEWEEMRERAMALGDAFTNEVRFDWEENQNQRKAENKRKVESYIAEFPPAQNNVRAPPRPAPMLQRDAKSRSHSAGMLAAFEEEDDDLHDSELHASISSLPLPSAKGLTRVSSRISTSSKSFNITGSSRSFNGGSSTSMRTSLNGSTAELRTSLHNSSPGAVVLRKSVHNSSPESNEVKDPPCSPGPRESVFSRSGSNLPPKLPSRQRSDRRFANHEETEEISPHIVKASKRPWGSECKGEKMAPDFVSKHIPMVTRSFHELSDFEKAPAEEFSRSVHGRSQSEKNVPKAIDFRSDLPESINVAEHRKSLEFSSDDSLSLDDL